jgi:hypothetical protein
MHLFYLFIYTFSTVPNLAMANLSDDLKVIIGSHEGAAHLLEQMQEEGSQGEEGGAQGEAAEEEGGIIQVGLFKPDLDPVFQVNPDPDTDPGF